MTESDVYNRYEDELHSNCNEDDEAMIIPRRARVKDMIQRFERSSVYSNSTDDNEEYVERRKKPPNNLFLPNYIQEDRNSSVSINSILSGASEASLESNSSGFVSDRKSGADYHPPIPHRPAPPPPEPFNDSSSSTSRSSSVPADLPYLPETRFSLPSPTRSPVALRRARQPPCIRRKSLVSTYNHQGDTLWSYGVRQGDLEVLLRLKRSDASDNDEDINAKKVELLKGTDSNDATDSDKDAEDDDKCSASDDVRTETVSIDQSTDTLKNEGDEGSGGSEMDENSFGSEVSGDRSNYDNISIKSISSFDNMVPYQQYDLETLSCDEFGAELSQYPESDFLTVSAVNDFCVSKSSEAVLIPVESKKEKYKRHLRERVNELIHTEAGYVDRLRHVVDEYVSKMSHPDVPLALRGLKPEIFANIERIHKFHAEEFLPALKHCENDLRKLGQCFRRFEKKFNMYVMYSRNNKRATKLVFEHKRYFQNIQHELGDRLDLSSYLLDPVQRIPRYKLFLDDLVKTYINYENEKTESDSRISELSEANSDDTGGSNGWLEAEETPLDSLRQAKSMVEYVLIAVDGIMALENIRECPINLLQQGRLLRQSEFMTMDNTRRRRQLMRIFLFDKVLLLTVVYRKQLTVELFIYRDHIPLDDLGITAKEHDKYKFTVWYRNRNLKSYKLETREPLVRDAWVEEITSLLWEQANQKKEMLLLQLNRSNRASMVSMDESQEQNPDKYNSLRGVPGEVRRNGDKTSRRTTWYCEYE